MSYTPRRTYGGVSAEERIAGRRERLLAAGLELFGTRGFAATGVKDVCRQAELTDRYFYESFKDTPQLFLAVFDGVIDELFAAVATAVAAADAEPRAQLHAAVDTFIRALSDDPRKARVVFFEAGAAGPAAHEHMNAALRRFTDLVALTTRGYLPDWPEDRLRVGALALVGMLERVVVEWQEGHLDLSIDAIVDNCVTVYVALFPASRPTGPRSAPDASPG